MAVVILSYAHPGVRPHREASLATLGGHRGYREDALLHEHRPVGVQRKMQSAERAILKGETTTDRPQNSKRAAVRRVQCISWKRMVEWVEAHG